MSTSSSTFSALSAIFHDYSSVVHHTWSKWSKLGDPRVRDWPLMRFDHMILVCLGYLILIPLLAFLMKFKQHPVYVKPFATLHNILLTTLSLYMCVEILHQAIKHHYSLFGNGVDRSRDGDAMARIIYIFYLSKIVEFIDTVIMCLKKNYHQITFLHLYHHSSIFFIWWLIVYFAPGGEAYFSAALNSFIHVLMYSYYLWSTYSPKLPPNTRPGPFHPAYYKRYITMMQMTQFLIMFIQACYDLLVPNPYPRFCIWILFVYMISMLALFANFFIQSYIKGGKNRKDQKGNQQDQKKHQKKEE